MGESTEISWCDHTFNPWIGCARVSAGCDNCYAESMAKRYGWHDWKNETPRHLTSDAYWRQPIRWNINARAAGVPARVFCASLADVFDPHAPAGARERLWELIAETPWLNWLILTKRPSPMRTMLPCVPQRLAVDWPNVWLGVSAEDQATYDQRMPLLGRDVADGAVRVLRTRARAARPVLHCRGPAAGLGDRRRRIRARRSPHELPRWAAGRSSLQCQAC